MPNQYLPDNYQATLNKSQQLQAQAAKAGSTQRYTRLTDPEIDIIWGQSPKTTYTTTKAPHAYFDYFFSGQDIKVYVEGVETPTVGELPIMDFAFNIQQQKTPVYGFWSYTYDAVMRGTRIVSGQFRIATKSTDYMTKVLSEAATTRANSRSLNPVRGLNEDEKNIEKYWTKNVDPATIGYKHIFSAHPPFNFVVVYGLQNISISPVIGDKNEELFLQYQENDHMLSYDENHRLVESDPNNNTMRFVIDSVELQQMQVEYTPDGAVCSEVYGFFARDISKVDTNNVRG